MDLRILGPLEIGDGDRRIPLGGPRQRALLATLILRANRPVPVEELIERIWGAAPPSSARLTLQGHILRLRRTLAGAGGVAIVTEPHGYRLSVDPVRVDVCRWAALIAAADRAAAEDDDATEAARLREALALWRGEPLADVESDSLRRDEAGRLAETRADALERRIEADLRLGLHRELIGELTALTAAQPLRESFRAQLMLALYRAGRRTDALEVYQDARRALVNELGVEPGPRLRRLEHGVLVADSSLDLDARPGGRDPSPCALPPDIPHFAGREEETEWVLTLPPPESVPAVIAVGGMAGIGKTAFVVHAAHLLAGRYPGGRLYAELGGTSEHPMAPGTALDQFLRLLGVRPGEIPAGTSERAALMRDRIAGRRVLLVLDNAADEAQVRPLIPGTPGCGVLISSRTPLIGLEYAHTLELDVLGTEAAVDLLAGVIGRERTNAEPYDARTLVARCGGLPLAVRIAAARLAGRPDWTLGRLADRLADEHRRLDRLSAGDLEVRSSIAISHDALAPEHRRPFRLIGLLDLPEVNSWMVAALLDGSADDADDAIDALVDARLLEASRLDLLGGYRYRCHDLVRIFAREQALALESPPDRRSLARVLERLLALALCADEALPSRRVRLPVALVRIRAAVSGEAPPDPLAWFEAERHTLTAAVRRAVSLGLAETAWRLASAALNFLDLRGYSDDWRETHELALRAAREHHDVLGEAMMLHGLGVLAYEEDHYEDAAAWLDRALATYRSLPDPAPIPEARMLSALGDVHHIRGRLDEALTCFRAALRISERHDDPIGRANGLLNLGLVRRDRGRTREAMADLDQALTIFRAAGDEHGRANVLKFMAATDYYSGADPYAARRHTVEAIRLFRRVGDVLGEHRALRLLAMLLADEGRCSPARALLGRCLAVFRERGDRFGEAATLWSLGRTACQVGDAGREIEHLQEALVLFRRLDVPAWEARTRRQLGAARRPDRPRP